MHKKLSPEERKFQIIQVALQLFAIKGYNKTTVKEIIDEAGISKGGFYHHYQSKEELLEDIVKMLIDGMRIIFEEVNACRELTALEKTNEYIRRINAYKGDKVIETAALMSELYSEGKNVLLEKKLYDFAEQNVAPIMKKIIFQGIKEGTFKTIFPEEAAETYVKLFIMMQQQITDLFHKALIERNKKVLEIMKRRYMFFQKLLEDTLGLKKDSLIIKEVMVTTAEKIFNQIIKSKNMGPK